MIATYINTGIPLICGSLEALISVTISPPAPSSLKTANPVIGHPPSSLGVFHEIMIELVIDP